MAWCEPAVTTSRHAVWIGGDTRDQQVRAQVRVMPDLPQLIALGDVALNDVAEELRPVPRTSLAQAALEPALIEWLLRGSCRPCRT